MTMTTDASPDVQGSVFEALSRRLCRYFYGHVRDTHTAEDLAQDAIAAALEGFLGFNELTLEDAWEKVQYHAQRLLTMWQKRHREVSLDLDIECQVPPDSAIDALVHEALAELSTMQRKVICICLDGTTFAAAAAEISEPVAYVARAHREATQVLKARLAPNL